MDALQIAAVRQLQPQKIEVFVQVEFRSYRSIWLSGFEVVHGAISSFLRQRREIKRTVPVGWNGSERHAVASFAGHPLIGPCMSDRDPKITVWCLLRTSGKIRPWWFPCRV